MCYCGIHSDGEHWTLHSALRSMLTAWWHEQPVQIPPSSGCSAPIITQQREVRRKTCRFVCRSSFSGSACMFEFLFSFVYSLQNRMRTGSMYLISHLLSSTCREEELGLVPIARSSLRRNILSSQVSYTHAKLSFVAVIVHIICFITLFTSKYTITSLKNVLLWYCGIKWQYHGT